MPFLHTFYRKYLILCGLVVCCLFSNAQKQDYIWLAGYESESGYDSINLHYWFGISKFDFNQLPVQLTRDSLGIDFSRSNSTISDSTGGNILFYSNGVEIRNTFDEIMPNGDSLGYIDNAFFLSVYGIPAFPQYHLVIPNPVYRSQYDLFHCFVDTFHISNGADLNVRKILRSTVDMDVGNMTGEVIAKNEIINDEESVIVIAANKHANGKDWWLVTCKANSNCYNIFLFNGLTVLKTNAICEGPQNVRGSVVAERFSPNGSIFASTITNNNSLNIFDFDRCEGTMNLRETIYLPELTTVDLYPTSVEISPNSRYLYVFAIDRIYQFDLWSSPIGTSKQTIAVYDTSFKCPAGQSFFQSQLGPNGKIYMNSGSTNHCASVIDRPDEAGDSCHFILNYPLPTFIDGLPYYPNYRLGALIGSACDTLTALTPTLSQRERELKVFPNPATDMVTVDYGYTNWEKGDVDLEITNAGAQLVYTQHLPMYSGFQRLDITQYAGGVYNVAIKRGNSIVATSQFVKN